MAAFNTCNLTYDGTGSQIIWATTANDSNCYLTSTATCSNFPPHSFAYQFSKIYFAHGRAFKTKKLAKAYENLIRSRKVANQLSFSTPEVQLRTIPITKRPSNAPSPKQVSYSKRKKQKERIGLKH